MDIRNMFSTIDAHAGGQPLRIVTSGIPPLRGTTYTARRDDLRSRYDAIRTMLLHEPRGHADMYGAVLVSPSAKGADYGVIFMTNDGYSTMCGHGIIALATMLIETGAFPADGPEARIGFETPAGVVQARASISGGKVVAVRFRNVPAFRLAHRFHISVQDCDIVADVAFGGAWYAIVAASDLGVELGTTRVRDLVDAGMAVKAAVCNALDVVHPEDAELSGLYGTFIVGEPSNSEMSLRNVTVYADGAIDRSPCGTGTSALVACMAAEGTLQVGDTLVNESLTGSVFTGRIVESTRIGPMDGVITEISGRGAVTGMHQFVVDRDDPEGCGFLLR